MRLPRYAEYKDSQVQWLGLVPTHWNVMPIRLAARLESGHTPSRSRLDWWENCTVPWFTLADVSQIRQGRVDVIYDTKEKVSELGLENSSARRLPAGTVMLSRTASVGFSAIMGVEMATTQDFANWVCGQLLRPRFLLQVFRSMQGEFARLMMGSTHNTIYMPDIAALKFALPPLAEQDAIVEFLDRETAKIDALIAEQEKLIALMAEKRQATISHAVTRGLNHDAPMRDSGMAWLGEVPAHWEVKRLKTMVPQITVGIVVEPSKYYCEEGVPALRSLNVLPGKVKTENLVFITEAAHAQLQKSRLHAGDLVSVRSGQTGTTAVIPSELDGCNCIDLIIIRKPCDDSERFLCWFLSSDSAVHQFSEGSGGAIQQHFNIGTAMNLVIPRPPIEEQMAIVSFLDGETSKLDTLKAEAERAIVLLKERRSALIAAAVTGQIDLRGALPQRIKDKEEIAA